MRVGLTSSAAALLLLATGCDLPRDPEKTLDRVRGGTLRVGVSAHEPWTDWKGDGSDRRPVGIEVELAEQFAKEIDAEVHWVRGSEGELLTALENFDLDLVAAGLTDDTPWKDRVGLSRTFVETDDGKHVLATPPGENDFLLRLDKFLARREAAIRDRLDEEGPVPAKAAVE